MNYFPLATAQQEWQERTAEMSARDIGPRAAEYDQKDVAYETIGTLLFPEHESDAGPSRAPTS